MMSLIDDLIKSAPPNPPYFNPRYSRKTKRITLTIYLKEVPVQVSLPIEHLESAIDGARAASDGTGPLQCLLDGLLDAWQKFGHIIERRKKPRGRQANRGLILIELKYASAWAYEFVMREWAKPLQDRYLPLQKAAQEFEIVARRTCHDAVEMAAFLVFHAYKEARLKHNIQTPWNDRGDFSAENYSRRYIKTAEGNRIHSRIQKTPALLTPLPKQALMIHDRESFEERWKAACQNGRLRNPLLQKLFAPWFDA